LLSTFDCLRLTIFKI